MGGQLAEQRAAVDDPLGVQMHHAALAGDLPIDAQQAGAGLGQVRAVVGNEVPGRGEGRA